MYLIQSQITIMKITIKLLIAIAIIIIIIIIIVMAVQFSIINLSYYLLHNFISQEELNLRIIVC